jgi:hypothetical protein
MLFISHFSIHFSSFLCYTEKVNGVFLMKKFKLIRRNKRIVIQLALLVPIVIITGVNLLYPSIFILSALAIRGLISLYGNDPYFKDNAELLSELNLRPKKVSMNPLDPLNIYLGHSTPSGRKHALGY